VRPTAHLWHTAYCAKRIGRYRRCDHQRPAALGFYCLFSYCGLYVFYGFLPGRKRLLILIFAFSIFPQTFFLDWYFRGRNDEDHRGGAGLFFSRLYRSGGRFRARSGTNYLGCLCGSLQEIRGIAALDPEVQERTSGSPSVRFPLFGLLKQSIPLSVGVVIGSSCDELSAVCSGIFQSTTEVGIYSAASRLVLLFTDRGQASFVRFFCPASMRRQEESPQKLASMISIAAHWILIAALPVAVGGILFAGTFYRFGFRPGIHRLQPVF